MEKTITVNHDPANGLMMRNRYEHRQVIRNSIDE